MTSMNASEGTGFSGSSPPLVRPPPDDDPACIYAVSGMSGKGQLTLSSTEKSELQACQLRWSVKWQQQSTAKANGEVSYQVELM